MVKHRVNHINLGSFPKKRDKEGRLICLNCGKQLTGRKEKYCGFECSNDWLCKHSHQWMRSKLIRERNRICNHCKRKFNTDELIADHIIPIALGGKEFDENNIQILCNACDKIKTKQDHKDIAKLRKDEKLEAVGQKKLTTLQPNMEVFRMNKKKALRFFKCYRSDVSCIDCEYREPCNVFVYVKQQIEKSTD